MNLRDELRRYSKYTVPDYLFEAWRIVFEGYSPPNKAETLRLAELDLKEDERYRPQKVFNENRRHMTERTKLKFNWSNK